MAEDDAGRIPPGMGGSKWRKPSQPRMPGDESFKQPQPQPTKEAHSPAKPPVPQAAPDGTVPSNEMWESLNVDVNGFKIDLRPEVNRLMSMESMGTDEFVREALLSMTVCGMILQNQVPPGVDKSDARVQSVLRTAKRVLGFIDRNGRTPVPGVDNLDE